MAPLPTWLYAPAGVITMIAAALCLVLAGPCLADETGTGTTGLQYLGDIEASAGHGRISLGFQSAFTQGVLNESGDDFLPNAKTDTRLLNLAVDYRLSDRWTLHASLPFIRKRVRDYPPAHNPALLATPHPESEFLDDGQYHGDWQDWQLGLSYYAQIGGFELRPHAFLVYPSHDYTFFAAAAVGQNLKRLRLGADASRRLGRSNFHFSAGYSYELVEKVLDINLNKHYFRLSGWYDFSPQFSATVYVNGRWSQGRNGSFFFAERARGSELWYQHDRLLRQNFVIAGTSLDWHLNDRWTLSAGAGRPLRASSVQRLRHAYDVQLSRNF